MGGKKRCRSQEQEARHGRNGRPCAAAQSGNIQHRGVRTGCSVWKAQADLLPEVGESALKAEAESGFHAALQLPWGMHGRQGTKAIPGKGRTERSQDRGTRAATGWQLANALQVSSVDTADTENLSNSTQPASPPPTTPQGSSLQVTHWKLRALPTSDTGPARRAGHAPWAGSPAEKGQSQTPACTTRLLVPCRRVAHTPRDQHTNRLSCGNLFP